MANTSGMETPTNLSSRIEDISLELRLTEDEKLKITSFIDHIKSLFADYKGLDYLSTHVLVDATNEPMIVGKSMNGSYISYNYKFPGGRKAVIQISPEYPNPTITITGNKVKTSES